MIYDAIAGIDHSSYAIDVVKIPLAWHDRPDVPYEHARIELRTKKQGGPEAMWEGIMSGQPKITYCTIWRNVRLAFIEHGTGGGSGRAAYTLGLVTGLVAGAVPRDVILQRATAAEWKIELFGRGFGNCRAAVYVEKLQEMGYDLPDENAYAALGIALAMRAKNARAAGMEVSDQ